MKSYIIKILSILITVSIVLGLYLPITVTAKTYITDEIYNIAIDLINWKKSDNGSFNDGYLINDKYLELAGTTPGDWYQIGMSCLEIEDDYSAYLAVIKDNVEGRYATKNKLSKSKATEWHRISLAVLASGGDPENIGTDKIGNPINLIADGTYNRGLTAPLGRQGINGWIWGLIALDSKKYTIPDGAFYTREEIIEEIISKKLPDGGFALSGNTYDTDITAMAIQALAPYYNERNDVKDIIDNALILLSNNQLNTGDFSSWEMPNSESTAQVIIALCSLGIDPLTDSRFIKDGNTLLDGLLRYRMPDGGFIHSFTYDKENPTSIPNKSNSMAGEQTLLALAAIWRLRNGKSFIYDFADTEKTVTPEFSDEDKKTVDELPQKPSTSYYVTVVKLLEKLENSSDFENKEYYRQRLIEAKAEIEKLQNKIDEINSNISNYVSPEKDGDSVNSDTENESNPSKPQSTALNSIIQEYEQLPEYDKSKIDAYEDVVKAKTKEKTLNRAIIVSVCCVIIIAVSVTLIIIRIKKRLKQKESEMDELAAMYGEDE